jgi:hypothetical protein
MFQQARKNIDGVGKGSVFYRGVSALGTAVGIGIAILSTPPVFAWTRGPLLAYLRGTWNATLASMLTWVFGGVEAFVVYAGTKLLFTSFVIWAMAALAARRFPGA